MEKSKIEAVPSCVARRMIRCYNADRSAVVDINPGQVIFSQQFPGGRQPREGEKDSGYILGPDMLIHMEIIAPGGCFRIYNRKEAKVACAMLGIDQIPTELPYPPA